MTKFSLCPSPLGHNESNTLTQNRCGGCFVVVVFFLHFHKDPSAVGCEMHVLYTPSCSKTQAHYITLHLSCQTH